MTIPETLAGRIRLQFAPVLFLFGRVACFPALWTGCKISRACYRFQSEWLLAYSRREYRLQISVVPAASFPGQFAISE